ncbi:MAG: hemerythrin domain-containing protein [Chloroflexi bacterium]|nr:hemerythrin domain-containing protein [Chloroflexota bacterium]
MVSDKSCPGTRTIREPRPEYINCPDCGKEVEIWTDELKATCPGCGNQVLRVQQASCIDWCPHARECIGPEAYERLRPAVEEDLSATDSPLNVLKREHDRVLDNLGLLHGASLCLQLGSLTPDSAVRGKGIEHLTKVLGFFDKDVRLHFRREEEVLFPALEKHLGVEKSPTRLLLKEHAAIWQDYGQLTEKLAQLQDNGNELSPAVVAEVQDIGVHIAGLLREHIKRENESLLPLATGLLGEKELAEVANKWKGLVSK